MLSSASYCRRRGLAELYSLCTVSREAPSLPRVRSLTQPADRSRLTSRPPQQNPQQQPRPERIQLVSSGKLDPEGALEEALEGRGEALYRCVASHLKSGNYRAAVELYDRYTNRYSTRQRPKDAELQIEDEINPGLSQSLLCAVSAYAMEDLFDQLLRAYLKIGAPRIPYELRAEHFEWLSEGESIRTKTQSFLDDLTSAHFVLKPTDLARYLTTLKKNNMTLSLRRLYEGILDGITRPVPFISPSESNTFHLPIAMTDSSWASFISAWVVCQRPDLARQAFHTLKDLGVRRGPATWTAYLQSFHHARDYDAAMEAWKEMHRETKPDAPAYQSMTALLFRSKQPREALAVFAEFQSGEKIFEPKQVLAVYNGAVDGLLRNRLLPQAEKFLEMMKARGVTPDVVTYNSFLSHFGRAKDFKGLFNAMAKMNAEGIKSDVYSFSTILSALLSAGRKDAVDLVLRVMKEQGVQANVAIYSAMIDDQLRGGDEAHWRAGMALLRTMEKNQNISPNNITYTTILTHLYRPNWLSPYLREEYRNEVLDLMYKRGLKFTLPDYHILMSTCLENPNESNVKTALGYYRAIRGRDIPCIQATYYILLSGLAAAQEWGVAREIMKDITFKDINHSLQKVMDGIIEHTQ